MFQPGEANPRWKGGKTTNRDGYIRITAGENRGKLEHRLLWEKVNGPIPYGFDVHHKNTVRNDNRLENFELRPSTPHRKETLDRVNGKKRKGLPKNEQASYHSGIGHRSH